MSNIVKPKRITMHTREGYDKQAWLTEAGRHLRSAKALRSIRKRRRAEYKRASHPDKLRHVLMMEATVHSSVLLLAYAFELVLKAGLTRAYVGCSKELFEREAKRRFGHNLLKLAREIEFPIPPAERRLLRDMENVITNSGRYPLLSIDMRQHLARQTKRSQQFWSDDRFRQLLKLLESIQKHVDTIDGDSTNPASYTAYAIDGDGYFAFRCGGNLSPRIVVRYSTVQRRLRKNNRRALRRLLFAHSSCPLLRHHWDTAKYRCVKQ